MKKVILDELEWEVKQWVKYFVRSNDGDWYCLERRPKREHGVYSAEFGRFYLLTCSDIKNRPVLLEFDNKCENNLNFLEKIVLKKQFSEDHDLFNGFKIPSVKEYKKGLDIYAMNTDQFDTYTDFCDAVNDQEMYHEAR